MSTDYHTNPEKRRAHTANATAARLEKLRRRRIRKYVDLLQNDGFTTTTQIDTNGGTTYALNYYLHPEPTRED